MAEEPKEEKVTKASQNEMDLEIKRLELEARKLEVQEKQANLQDLKERLAEREARRETKFQRARTRGESLEQSRRARKLNQARCNHRKGGDGLRAIVGGQGD